MATSPQACRVFQANLALYLKRRGATEVEVPQEADYRTQHDRGCVLIRATVPPHADEVKAADYVVDGRRLLPRNVVVALVTHQTKATNADNLDQIGRYLKEDPWVAKRLADFIVVAADEARDVPRVRSIAQALGVDGMYLRNTLFITDIEMHAHSAATHMRIATKEEAARVSRFYRMSMVVAGDKGVVPSGQVRTAVATNPREVWLGARRGDIIQVRSDSRTGTQDVSYEVVA